MEIGKGKKEVLKKEKSKIMLQFLDFTNKVALPFSGE